MTRRTWSARRRYPHALLGEHRRDEAGVGIVEMIIAVGIFGLVMAAVITTVVTETSSVTTAGTLGLSGSTGGLLVNQISAEIVSADVIFNPATEGSDAGTEPNGSAIPAGFSFRALTEVNGASDCVQWRLLSDDYLQTRTWSNNWAQDGVVGTWRTEATNVVNPTGTPPFSLVSGGSGSNYGYRLLQLNLELTTGTTQLPGTPVDLQSSITARDAEYYRPPSSDTQDCSPIPTP